MFGRFRRHRIKFNRTGPLSFNHPLHVGPNGSPPATCQPHPREYVVPGFTVKLGPVEQVPLKV